MNTLDSNNFNSTIRKVCSDCGIEANRLTCLKKHGAEPLKKKYDVSTFHTAICDFCHREKWVTEVRDFFYPDFSLMRKKPVQLFWEANSPADRLIYLREWRIYTQLHSMITTVEYPYLTDDEIKIIAKGLKKAIKYAD